jgi:D-galactarolactone cycloisomerase
MKITRISGVVYRQQLKPGGSTPKFAGEGRNAFETLLVKVETDSGIVGWGEAFPHRVWPAVKSLLENLIAPACIGVDPLDIPALMKKLIYHVHGVGRAGPVMYALTFSENHGACRSTSCSAASHAQNCRPMPAF